MTGLETIQLSDCEKPVPAPGELLVRIRYVGLCGSDLHFYKHGRIGKKVVDRPLILGHECTGVVEGMGKAVSGFKLGDMVVLEPGVPCGTCQYCLGGRYNLCPSVKFMASPPTDGALRRYLTYPAHMAFRLPEGVSAVDGAMIEPLAVGLHAATRGGVGLGKSVCILGAGPIGIMTLMACRAMSATRIIVTDLYPERLEKAKRCGADVVVDASQDAVEQAVLEATGGEGADIVFESAGSPATLAQAPALVKRGGVIVLVGNITQPVNLEMYSLTSREVDIRPVFRYRNIFPVAIQAIASGIIPIELIEPDIFEFEDTPRAFAYTLEHAAEVLKVLVKVSSGERE